MKDDRQKNLILTLILWVVMGCAGMMAMLYVASAKTIVIADVAQEQNEEQTADGRDERHNPVGKQILLQEDKDAENSICIPLEKGTKAENVVMENRYMEQELWVYLKGADTDFYLENPIYGDLSVVTDGYEEKKQNSLILKFQMAEVLEYRSTMESNTLKIVFSKPKDLYSLVVVIDPAGGGGDRGVIVDGFATKTVTLEVAKRLQKKLEQEDIKLYFTRLEDEKVSDERRSTLAEAVDADIFISLSVAGDEEHPEKYGVEGFYNENYVIPNFGNVELADVLTRNVTIAAGNRAIGLFPAPEESVLREIQIPAAQVCLGYLTNGQERALLGQEKYQEKLAEGLANAILEVYTPYVEQE